MRVIMATSVLMLASTVNAREVDLVCTGIETVLTSTTVEKNKEVYEVSFDDKRRLITRAPPILASGCISNTLYKSESCDCVVDENTIKCESKSISVYNQTAKKHDSFFINRKTGRMQTSRQSSAVDTTRNTPFNSIVSGEFSCEVHKGRKF
jgi:hypothetical protein